MLTDSVSPMWAGRARGSLSPAQFAVRETPEVVPPKPRLLDRVRAARRARHLSDRTEDAYVAWISRSACAFGGAMAARG